MSVVTVVLPLVPVTATSRGGCGRCRSRSTARSTSDRTGIPAARARTIAGWSGCTPGLGTTRSACRDHVGHRRVVGRFEHRRARGDRARRALAVHVTGRPVLDDGHVVTRGARDVDHRHPGAREAHDEDTHQSSTPGMLMKSA